MTSSLVGSEMCIRDSPITRKPVASLSPSVVMLIGPGLLHRRQTLKPVSYTHLTLPTICSV
eukprot:2254443-Prorocentrum_lima.AAC.1